MHVVKTPRVRLFLADLVGVLLTGVMAVIMKPSVFGQLPFIVAETEFSLCSCPAGPFPLRFGWQRVCPAIGQSARFAFKLREFLTEFHRIEPTDESRRKVIAYFSVLLPFPGFSFYHLRPFGLSDLALAEPVAVGDGNFDRRNLFDNPRFARWLGFWSVFVGLIGLRDWLLNLLDLFHRKKSRRAPDQLHLQAVVVADLPGRFAAHGTGGLLFC
jgi:hypothetical protein